MDEALEYLQQVDPLWSVALVALALGVLLVVKFWRSFAAYVFAGAIAFALVGAVATAAYYGYAYFEDQRRLEERRVLEERAETLFSKTIEPDSVFACLDGSAVPAMLEACERSLFAEPQRVAAAVAIVTQRLAFLDDALRFADERDPGYADRVASMRKAVESDPYGFVAFVLSVEHGCTHESCARFSMLRDSARVRENMRVRRLEAYLAKHSTTWRGSSELPADSVPTAGGITSSPIVTISGEPAVAPAATEQQPSTSSGPMAAATNEPAVPPVLLPMIPPPSAATVAAELPAAAAAPVVTPPSGSGFAEPEPPAEAVAARPAPVRRADESAKGNAAKSAPRPQTQAKAKAKQSDPASRRSAEPVAGLPRVVPSDYIREAEEKEEATAQTSASRPGAPTPISPPQQNFTGN